MWPDVAFLSEKSLIAGCWSSRRREEGNSRPKSRGRSVPRCLLACHVCFVLTRSCVQEKALARPATWTAACQNFYTRRRPSAQLRGRIMVVDGKGGRRVGEATRPGIMSFLVRGQGSKGVSGTRTGRASGGSGPRQTSLLSCLMGRGRVTW